jgi:hypothetical protein
MVGGLVPEVRERELDPVRQTGLGIGGGEVGEPAALAAGQVVRPVKPQIPAALQALTACPLRGPPDLVDREVEVPHEVEAVERDRGVREVGGRASDERRGHVHDQLGDRLRPTAVRHEVLAEQAEGAAAPARGWRTAGAVGRGP